MRTLLLGVLLAGSSFGTTALAQTAPVPLVDKSVTFDLRVSPRARIEFRIEDVLRSDEANRYAIPRHLSLVRDSCVRFREWSVITPFQDCSHDSIKRGRPKIRLVYVF
jgi:hypothetical protein